MKEKKDDDDEELPVYPVNVCLAGLIYSDRHNQLHSEKAEMLLF